jgi:hypothetical protein
MFKRGSQPQTQEITLRILRDCLGKLVTPTSTGCLIISRDSFNDSSLVIGKGWQKFMFCVGHVSRFRKSFNLILLGAFLAL